MQPTTINHQLLQRQQSVARGHTPHNRTQKPTRQFNSPHAGFQIQPADLRRVTNAARPTGTAHALPHCLAPRCRTRTLHGAFPMRTAAARHVRAGAGHATQMHTAAPPLQATTLLTPQILTRHYDWRAPTSVSAAPGRCSPLGTPCTAAAPPKSNSCCPRRRERCRGARVPLRAQCWLLRSVGGHHYFGARTPIVHQKLQPAHCAWQLRHGFQNFRDDIRTTWDDVPLLQCSPVPAVLGSHAPLPPAGGRPPAPLPPARRTRHWQHTWEQAEACAPAAAPRQRTASSPPAHERRTRQLLL